MLFKRHPKRDELYITLATQLMPKDTSMSQITLKMPELAVQWKEKDIFGLMQEMNVVTSNSPLYYLRRDQRYYF